jgi:tripeptide aminopeptidase
MKQYNYSVSERFMRYVQIDTQSDPHATCFPSTEKQKDLGKVLVQELLNMGLSDAEMDASGYVFATVKSNTTKNIPTICFCAHMDTAPDCSGTNVKPILHKNWDGSDIVLPDDTSQVISIAKHGYLKAKIGQDIITASGLTLLGADDKAGIAIIMDLAEYLLANPSVKHGDIRILFTPDEEVGRGVEELDMVKLNAKYGYTLDGGPLASFEDETFSADGMTFTFHGISAHPGYAKGKMVNSMKVAAHFMNSLPLDEWCPESTYDRQGFVHPVGIEGELETTTVSMIIRDHDTVKLKVYEDRLVDFANKTIAAFPGARVESSIKEQYRNMKEILVDVPFVTEFGLAAIQRAGMSPEATIIRGGTDGSRLSFMGLPCPNIFTGEMAIHSKHEYAVVQDMQKAVDTLIELVQVWEEKGEGL